MLKFTDLDAFIEHANRIIKDIIDQLPYSENLVHVARQLLKESVRHGQISTTLRNIAEQILSKQIPQPCLQYITRGIPHLAQHVSHHVTQNAAKGVAVEVGKAALKN